MSQNPPPPLDSVPITGLRKRKPKNSSAQQTNSGLSNNNQTTNSAQSSSQTQPTTGTNINDNKNALTQQPNQTPTVITDLSSLGPLKQRRTKPKSSTTQTPQANVTESQPITKLNDNNNNSPEKQLTIQTEQTSSDQPITNVAALGPLKQRKSRQKPAFVEPPTESSQTNAQTKQTVIETNEIPNIDISTDSSTENLHFSSSSGSRLGLDIEQDNAHSARYMNPNFDLSKIGKNESRQILNKSISKEYAERFTKDMTAREEQFRNEYVKPKERNDEQLVNSSFIQSELNSMIDTISQNIQKNTEKFDLSKCNFNGISTTENLFKPNLNGLAKSYTASSQEAVDLLTGKREFLSIDDLKKELDANFLNTPNESTETKEDFIKQIRSLLTQSSKQTSPTEFVIDLSKQESINLFCNIALFFSSGLKYHSSILFDKLYNQMNEDSCGRANIVSLQASLLQAKSTITDITGSYRYTVFYILHLIQLAQCSSLLRYMSGILSFKKKNYYSDALILDSDLCNSLSEEVEKIECAQLQGDLLRINIPDGVPAPSGDSFSIRISGIVESYLRKIRNWLLQGVNINTESTEPLTDILKIFAKSFLIQKNGSCLSLDALSDIFEGIASLSEQNLDPCCNHQAYKKFIEIYRGKEVSKYWDTKSRIWTTIVLALNEKILPYIILFAVTIPQTRTTMNPSYFIDPVCCLRIAHALLPMNFPTFNVRYETIKNNVSTLD